MNSIENALLVVLAFAHWCVLVAGVVVCFIHRYLSRSIWLILAGLAGLVATGVLQWVFFSFFNQLGADHSAFRFVFPVTSGINLCAWIMIVAGLALSFRDVTERIRTLHYQLHQPSPYDPQLGN